MKGGRGGSEGLLRESRPVIPHVHVLSGKCRMMMYEETIRVVLLTACSHREALMQVPNGSVLFLSSWCTNVVRPRRCSRGVPNCTLFWSSVVNFMLARNC